MTHSVTWQMIKLISEIRQEFGSLNTALLQLPYKSISTMDSAPFNTMDSPSRRWLTWRAIPTRHRGTGKKQVGASSVDGLGVITCCLIPCRLTGGGLSNVMAGLEMVYLVKFGFNVNHNSNAFKFSWHLNYHYKIMFLYCLVLNLVYHNSNEFKYGWHVNHI